MKQRKLFIALFALIFISLFFAFTGAQAQEGDPPDLSVQSYTPAVPPRVFLMDDPVNTDIRIPTEVNVDELRSTGTLFQIDYVSAGGQDLWGEPCVAFSPQAKAAFEAAAAIWASKLSSDVPVTILACWSDFGDPDILGYSGGNSYYRYFDNSPYPSVWYQSALANSIAGYDLDPNDYDMHITYNSEFNWYYGTDANPGVGQYDLVTVAAHEIAHGLHFSGVALYDWPQAGQGTFGIPSGIPDLLSDISPTIYDTFIEDSSGTRLTAYANPSAALNTAFTSNNLWFDGPNANAANGNARVKIYAPATWSDGSSYAHLDYLTFYATEHNMMVYAIGSGSANHNPGAVTLGIFKDMGWELAANPPANDNFSAAQTVSSPSQITNWDTSGATNEDTDPLVSDCGIGQGKATVWYKYTHSGATSAISVDTEGVDYDTFIAVWIEDNGSLTPVACNGSLGGVYESNVAFQVEDQTTYYIEVGYPYP